MSSSSAHPASVMASPRAPSSVNLFGPSERSRSPFPNATASSSVTSSPSLSSNASNYFSSSTSSASAHTGTTTSSMASEFSFQVGDALKLKREGPHGVWLAEVNGALVKVALTFVASAEEKEDKRLSPEAKKARKTKRVKKAKKGDPDDGGVDAAEETELVDLGAHPAPLPAALSDQLSLEVDSLKAELVRVRLELDLATRSFHEHFPLTASDTDSKALPSALRLHASPDELMFEKMLESPYVSTSGHGKGSELALAPRVALRSDTLLLPAFNLGAVREEDAALLRTLKFDALQLMDSPEGGEYTRLLACHMFAQLGLIDRCGIDERSLWRLLLVLQAKYRRVPFHNWYHAFNVCQTLFFFLTTCNAQHLLGPLELLSLMLAALAHDADHPGLNNTFQNKAATRVSALHKKSALENHHLLQAYHALSRPECNGVLGALSDSERDVALRYVRDLVLATDLALHGVILRNLEENRKTLAKHFNKARPTLDAEEKVVLMCALIKCADLSNEIRPTEVAQKWAKLVVTEFFAQSDKERELNLPVTPFMDRDKVILANEQINFISKLCMPLYTALQAVCPGMVVCLDQMKTNLKQWNQRLLSFYNKDSEADKAKLATKSLWERDQVKGDAKAKLSDVIGKQSSGPAPAK